MNISYNTDIWVTLVEGQGVSLTLTFDTRRFEDFGSHRSWEICEEKNYWRKRKLDNEWEW